MIDLYTYKCSVLRIIDGDTVELSIDLGLNVHIHHVCRLYGIDAAEVRSEPETAAEATARLSELLANTPIICRTIKDRTGKYGRYLVTLIDKHGTNINEAMVLGGYAARYPAVK